MEKISELLKNMNLGWTNEPPKTTGHYWIKLADGTRTIIDLTKDSFDRLIEVEPTVLWWPVKIAEPRTEEEIIIGEAQDLMAKADDLMSLFAINEFGYCIGDLIHKAAHEIFVELDRLNTNEPYWLDTVKGCKLRLEDLKRIFDIVQA